MLIQCSVSFIESLCCHWLLPCLDENMYTLSSVSQSPIEKLIVEYKDPSKKGGSSVSQSSSGGYILARFPSLHDSSWGILLTVFIGSKEN